MFHFCLCVFSCFCHNICKGIPNLYSHKGVFMIEKSVVYVVGLKFLDEQKRPVKKNYTFVSGPFPNTEEAFQSAREKIGEFLKRYKCIETEFKKFYIAEKENALVIYCQDHDKSNIFLSMDIVPINAEVPVVFAGGPVTASVKGSNSEDKNIIYKRLQRKAKQALASIVL